MATFLFTFVAPYDSSKSEKGSCSVKFTGLPVTGRPRISAASRSVIRISPPERSTNARLPLLHASISSVRNTLFRQWFGTDRRFPKPVREIADLCSGVSSCTRFANDLSENRVLKGFFGSGACTRPMAESLVDFLIGESIFQQGQRRRRWPQRQPRRRRR
ncbi:hypothetical protein V8G54_009348 [Vigna mungo]|uniref:Uncharacterized protein n=1 Tax=Vigna mungo TaxID=3915 RepID=A0AAQ3S5D6_VIGMU